MQQDEDDEMALEAMLEELAWHWNDAEKIQIIILFDGDNAI